MYNTSYVPMETSNIERMDAFYEQLKEVQRKLPKVGIMIAMGDLNAKVGSNNILLGLAMVMMGVYRFLQLSLPRHRWQCVV